MKNALTTTVWVTLAILVMFFAFEIPIQSYSLIRNLLYLLMPLYAAGASYGMLRSYGVASQRSVEYMLLFAGTLSLLIGESLWVYYDQILLTDPFPSIADIFYVLTYPLFLSAIFLEMKHSRVRISEIRRTDLAMWLGVISLFCVFVVQIGIIQAYDPGAKSLANMVSMLYGVGDLFILAASFLTYFLIRSYKGGVFSRFWIYVGVGFICMLAADVLFAGFQATYARADFLLLGLTDLFWTLHSFFMTLAFLHMIAFQSKIRKVHP